MVKATPARDIIHLDMDAFFASVEVLDRPELAGRPVIVGGGGRRSVVSAASYEARKHGVHSAMPMGTAKRLCPQGIFLPVRMDRYQEVSDRIFAIFRRFTPLVEPLSIDEAFLDVTGCGRLFGSPGEIARRIKEAVREETGLTVSAGVASSKLVAKIASDMRKPDGLTIVPRGQEKAFLAPLPVSRLWGVGKVTEEVLRELGVRTIGDLSRLPADLLKRRFGEHGLHLHLLANAIDDRPVEGEHEAKSIGHEETYDEDLTDPGAIRRELLSLADRVGARLRRDGARGRTVTLKVKYADFTLVTRALTLPLPTDDGGEIYRSVLDLLPRTEAGRRPLRLLGISLSRLARRDEREGEGGAGAELEERDAGEESWSQLPLFGPGARGEPGPARAARDPEEIARLNAAVDRIRERFGRKGIGRATLLDGE